MKQSVFYLLSLLAIQNVICQDNNQIIVDPNTGSEILYGYCNREGLTSGEFGSWFEPEYQSYQVDETTLGEIDRDFLFNCSIIIVLGTWCSDSQREVPRFYKILDHLHFPEKNLTLICVDRKKNAGDLEIMELSVELVPTIILSSGDEELGRIIESPVESLEIDLAGILQQ